MHETEGHIIVNMPAVFQQNSSDFGPKIRAFQPTSRNLVFRFARIRPFKHSKRTIWSRFLPEFHSEYASRISTKFG